MKYKWIYYLDLDPVPRKFDFIHTQKYLQNKTKKNPNCESFLAKTSILVRRHSTCVWNIIDVVCCS